MKHKHKSEEEAVKEVVTRGELETQEFVASDHSHKKRIPRDVEEKLLKALAPQVGKFREIIKKNTTVSHPEKK